MSKENLFEIATREKMRFPFKGLISVEDLWDLSPAELDKIFKILNSELKQAQEESLLNTKTKKDEELEIKIEIIKHIVNVKLEEKKAREEEVEKAKQRQKIMEILSKKEDEELQKKSPEELRKMLEEL